VDSEYLLVLRISISEFLLAFIMKYEGWRKTLMKKNVIVVATLAIAALMIVVVFAAITSIRTIPSTGTIAGVNLGVYSNIDLAPIHILDDTHGFVWPTVNPDGPPVTVTIYIVNTGTTDLTLSMTTDTWVEQHGLAVTWDQGGTVVHRYTGPGDIVTATLTLTADPIFRTGADFSVHVIITGTH
jgi:hypothetical protein